MNAKKQKQSSSDELKEAKNEQKVQAELQKIAEEIQQAQVKAKRPAYEILDSYLTDLSLENPHAPNIFHQLKEADASNTKGSLDYSLSYRKLAKEHYELRLKLLIDFHFKDQKVYILEIEYGSVVRLLDELTTQAVALLIYVEAAKALFPFLRAQAMQTLQTANMPIRSIQPIDFFTIYRTKLANGELEPVEKPAKA